MVIMLILGTVMIAISATLIIQVICDNVRTRRDKARLKRAEKSGGDD
jgi:hypothetical protein